MNELNIYHFMPDKLNLYSDIGNIIALRQRAKLRNIKVNVIDINETEGITLDDCDIFFIGGGSDREQSLATKELSKIKTILKDAIEDGMPGLTICGGYQFLGSKYITPDGTELEGLNILDFYTKSQKDRLTGDIVIESETFGTIVGFENHGGRTYHDFGTLGNVTHGFGNNDKDGKEGIHYKNLLGTYLHGPILPKNHEITDYLLTKACERKGIPFEPVNVDNDIEEAAKQVIVDRVKK
ncbi:type 1 glutamine amidotransferase [Staphylococcus kloosii]|jgi:CobQ-like glutamine amidotransferase family enzyme|uniref:Lipid II isoglutaminyl synthase (glutamine-hydrolyzing) subunit GatD n=1 Tax=Staphylococcus kloosii TaxID=29384 RepID=A0ABQ0XME8_9STAP|nr:glutamine amidotransferase [Staphylococcus kloosii]AVQ35731.1 glutamine amidotransferase [Staphylococcus kloosii]MBF7021675.1 glutamine amidotransferase [Staphylococcus kloosii]PNZ06187.1 glutamine amidotransferase [Staphylococcus kloosii]PTJ77649.1 glutamine amidotransferase [Staphylococcus kloosii]SUM48789.1 glutamine amidotransferase [Staphylococcus kloosii]